MKGLRKYLTPFAPDQSGAVSVLYSTGALTVIIDAGGCAGNICGFDEPRWHTQKSAVFSAGLRDIDAILGRDDLLVKKVEAAVRYARINENNPDEFKFVALVGTPVPSVIGTDYSALVRMIEKKTGLPAVFVPTNGMLLYDSGEEKAWLELFKKFAVDSEGKSDTIGILGHTPLDFEMLSPDEIKNILFENGIDNYIIYGQVNGADDIKKAGTIKENIVVSPSGIAAAKYLESRFKTPYKIYDPFAARLLPSDISFDDKSILIVHQSVAAYTLEKLIKEKYPTANITKVTWFLSPPETGEFVSLKEEDDFEALLRDNKFDIIIADNVMREMVKDLDGVWIDARHFAVSGRS
ncbi:MAG: nitrogenase molybdenum-iron protein [Clostridiales bacterium]|nr:nitrogenase molybdenum-iron protein [Clostridiales bacterium]